MDGNSRWVGVNQSFADMVLSFCLWRKLAPENFILQGAAYLCQQFWDNIHTCILFGGDAPPPIAPWRCSRLEFLCPFISGFLLGDLELLFQHICTHGLGENNVANCLLLFKHGFSSRMKKMWRPLLDYLQTWVIHMSSWLQLV
jgi:hypothetical protein